MRRSITTLALLAVTLLALAGPGTAGPSARANHRAHEHTHGPDGKWMDRQTSPAAEPYEVDAHAPWSAADWDGLAPTTDRPDLTSLPTVHAIYLYPSDATSRFQEFAAMFQADAKQASDRINTSYGRAIRFDMRSGNCYQSGANCLDITVVKSRHDTATLSTSGVFNTVYSEVAALFPNYSSKKYVVWLDAPNRTACGQGTLYQDAKRYANNSNNVRRTLSIIYRPYDTSDPLTGDFCRGRTLLHELGHNMGALQRRAPNQFDGAHCDDSAEDVMCYRSHTSNDTGDGVFDYNNDDYWDPIANPALGSSRKLKWWTVNLSKYICPLTGCQNPSTPAY